MPHVRRPPSGFSRHAGADCVAALVSHPLIAQAIAAGLAVFWWDPLAAMAATTQPGVVDYERLRMRVIQTGPSTGRTVDASAVTVEGCSGSVWEPIKTSSRTPSSTS